MGDGFDLDKYRSIATNTRKSEWGVARREYRTESGRVRKTRDELGNVVTEHAQGDRQDVLIKAPTVNVRVATTTEIRD